MGVGGGQAESRGECCGDEGPRLPSQRRSGADRVPTSIPATLRSSSRSGHRRSVTNLGVTLTYTDTKTDTVKVYENPVRTAFVAVQDTNAFGTCP